MMPYFDEKKMEWEVYHRQFDGWHFLHVKFDPAKNPNWLVVRAWPWKPSDEEVSVTKGITIRVLDLFVDNTNYCESHVAMEAEQ